jgi:hypothetical protein
MPEEPIEVKGPGHETTKEKLPPVDRSGINTRAVLTFCGALIVIAVVVHIVIWYLFRTLDNHEKAKDPVLSPLAPKQQQLPPEPRLQASPNSLNLDKQLFDPKNVETLKEDADQQLNNYGWIDAKNGIVRIPIKDAMKMIVADKEKQSQTAPTQTQKNKSSNVQH